MSSAVMLWLVGLALPVTAFVTNGGRVPALSDITGRMPLLTLVVAALLGVFWRQDGRPQAVARHQLTLALVFAAAIASTLAVPYALLEAGAKAALGVGITLGLGVALLASGRAAAAVEHRRFALLALASLALVASWLVFDSGSAGFAAQLGALAAAAVAGAALPQGRDARTELFAPASVAWFAAFATLLLGSVLFGGLGALAGTALAALPLAALAAFGRRHRSLAVVASLALLAVGASACGNLPFGKARYEAEGTHPVTAVPSALGTAVTGCVPILIVRTASSRVPDLISLARRPRRRRRRGPRGRRSRRGRRT